MIRGVVKPSSSGSSSSSETVFLTALLALKVEDSLISIEQTPITEEQRTLSFATAVKK